MPWHLSYDMAHSNWNPLYFYQTSKICIRELFKGHIWPWPSFDLDIYLLLVKKYQGDLLEFKGNTLVQGYPKKPQWYKLITIENQGVSGNCMVSLTKFS